MVDGDFRRSEWMFITHCELIRMSIVGETDYIFVEVSAIYFTAIVGDNVDVFFFTDGLLEERGEFSRDAFTYKWLDYNGQCVFHIGFLVNYYIISNFFT